MHWTVYLEGGGGGGRGKMEVAMGRLLGKVLKSLFVDWLQFSCKPGMKTCIFSPFKVGRSELTF